MENIGNRCMPVVMKTVKLCLKIRVTYHQKGLGNHIYLQEVHAEINSPYIPNLVAHGALTHPSEDEVQRGPQGVNSPPRMPDKVSLNRE